MHSTVHLIFLQSSSITDHLPTETYFRLCAPKDGSCYVWITYVQHCASSLIVSFPYLILRPHFCPRNNPTPTSPPGGSVRPDAPSFCQDTCSCDREVRLGVVENLPPPSA
jgi:hypothetical protein